MRAVGDSVPRRVVIGAQAKQQPESPMPNWTGCSKWSPIEHRLFSHISLNWAGMPLRTFDTVIRYIERTEAVTGL
jgi:hypothetical protein